MPRPCTCDRLPPPGDEYRPGEDCRLCFLFHHDDRYRALWGRGSSAAARCVHLGDPTGARVRCPSCRGHVELKLLACAVHGACTPTKPAPGVACCVGCPDFTPPSPLARPVVRNLLYHVYPLRGAPWRRNLEHLLGRVDLFNGRRVVAAVTDAHTDDPREVEALLADRVDEVVRLPNLPELREVATFLPLFSRVRSLHPSHVTFYAHAKGVSRTGHGTAAAWADLLLEANLDYWPAVEGLLDRFPVVGSLKKVGRGWPDHESRSEWHYSGSWFWFRNRDLFSRPDWHRVDAFWSGIEPYPSLHFAAHEAGCLFWEKPLHEVNLYDHGYFHGRVLPAWEDWKRDNAHRRTVP